jgi:transcriptional/translational regulatory protein YebC/TACO1
LMDISPEDEEKLGQLLTLLDEQDDTQEIVSNARGYESTSDE